MRRDLLAHEVRERLKRLPPPHDSHYGVVPLPPPESSIVLGDIASRHAAAIAAMARADAFADIARLFIVSRILVRREAVSSSSIEGTYSTLDALLVLEESEGESDASVDTKQVRDYARVLGRFIEKASAAGPAIFTLGLVEALHAEIMKGDGSYPDDPGALRSTVVGSDPGISRIRHGIRRRRKK